MWKALTRSLLILAVLIATGSCNKVDDTIVIITVVDEDGDVVPAAYVRIYANPTFPLGDPVRLDMEGNTDDGGKITFDFTEFYKQGQAGFAVLDLLCTKDTLVGEDIIKVLEEEVNEKTVTIE